ncbi:MAG: S26 family signal peptidase [Streptococcus parasanguinis]
MSSSSEYLGLALLILRPYLCISSIVVSMIKMAKCFCEEWMILVVATKNAQVDRSDLVLYKVGGKEYLGRVIAKENDEVSYVDDVLYLNGQATPEPYLNKMLNKHLAAPT